MLKFLAVLCLLGVALAVPPKLPRSKEEVEDFRVFLENIKQGDGLTFEQRMAANPKANPWENSGKFEGDMLIDDEQIKQMIDEYAAGGRMAWNNVQWPGNTVVWEFAPGHFTQAQENALWDTIRTIEAQTCVRFRYRNPGEQIFVRLTTANTGCWAHIGYWAQRGMHEMNLGPGCWNPVIVIHEWLHILGFVHMQSTYNRYDFVRILWENMQAGTQHNFDRYESNVVNNLGLPYEYISCMHYSSHAFSWNGQPTIQATQWHEGVMGQQNFVTALDWLRLRRYYNCPGAWNAEMTQDVQNVIIQEEVLN